ncbi:hypothetical protein [Bartonella taylorii]|uniref:hypothetical protein n=1 Tax=Bartonella taylorii TaxID=33046 RepID=UPI001ABA64AC|nr:hypothetical protein [Bartonella taylorii]
MFQVFASAVRGSGVDLEELTKIRGIWRRSKGEVGFRIYGRGAGKILGGGGAKERSKGGKLKDKCLEREAQSSMVADVCLRVYGRVFY